MSYKNPLIYVNRFNPTCPSGDCVVPVNYPVYRSLCINEMKCSHTGETAYSYADDIQLLLMQKNYMANSPYDYSQFIASMSKNTVKPVSKPKMTDKQLLSYIKSRHIQSPSELQSWLNYLSSRYDIVKSDVKSVVDDIKSSAGSDPELNPSPTPALSNSTE